MTYAQTSQEATTSFKNSFVDSDVKKKLKALVSEQKYASTFFESNPLFRDFVERKDQSKP
jgi:hypothetical protein